MTPRTVFHAFNWPLSEVENKIPWLREKGFDAVQVSPLQKCLQESSVWYHRYQPFDYSVLSGLGDEHQLRSLCARAKESNIIVVADVVFNHMGGVCGAEEARAAWKKKQEGDPTDVQAIESRLSAFPQFGPEDFHPFLPITGAAYDDDSLRCVGWGGEGTWPDLKPTPKVLLAQKQHLELLSQCGVRGFRFDAVKQMFVNEQYVPLVQHCRNLSPDNFVYGEVLSTFAEMHKDYAMHALSTDFILLQGLVHALEKEKNLAQLVDPPRLACPAVTFGRNHDTHMQVLPTLSFTEKKCAGLANVYLLAQSRPDNPVLVLSSDLEEPEVALLTELGLRYRKDMSPDALENETLIAPWQKKKALWLGHGAAGGILINGGKASLTLKEENLKDWGLNGYYKIDSIIFGRELSSESNLKGLNLQIEGQSAISFRLQ